MTMTKYPQQGLSKEENTQIKISPDQSKLSTR